MGYSIINISMLCKYGLDLVEITLFWNPRKAFNHYPHLNRDVFCSPPVGQMVYRDYPILLSPTVINNWASKCHVNILVAGSMASVSFSFEGFILPRHRDMLEVFVARPLVKLICNTDHVNRSLIRSAIEGLDVQGDSFNWEEVDVEICMRFSTHDCIYHGRALCHCLDSFRPNQ